MNQERELELQPIHFGGNIATASGFDLGAKAPLDSRFTVRTIEERDAHVTNNRAYEGMLVFVEADDKTYQYVNNTWKEFGFNQADFQNQVVDNLTTADSRKALSANQGKVLKTSLDAHTSDAVKHITANERTAWNAKADQTAHDALAERVTTAESDITNLKNNKADKTTMTTELGKKVDKTAIGTAASKNVGTSAGQVPVLDSNGKLVTAVLPAISTNESFTATSIEDAMSKPVQIGDLVILNASKEALMARAPYSSELETYIASGVMTYICVEPTAETFESKFRPLQSAADTISKGEVEQALALKADKSTMTQELAKKANQTDHKALENKVATSESKISSLETTVGNASSGLVKGVADNKAAIAQETKNRTSADTALSERIDALNTTMGSHTHAISSVTGLQDALDSKAGLTTATSSVNGLMAKTDKSKLDAIAAGAEVNQNAFSNVKIGSVTVAADAKQDTIEFVAGTNISITADESTDKVTINSTYAHPNGDGNKHVPANGTGNGGRFLQAASTAGVYQWAALPEASTTAKGIIKIGTGALDAAAGNHAHASTAITFAGGTGVLTGDTNVDEALKGLGVAVDDLVANKRKADWANIASKPFTTVDTATLDTAGDKLAVKAGVFESPSGAQAKATAALNNAKAYTDTKVADLVNSSPEALDTLNELAAALGNDPNFATTVTSQIGLKSDKTYVDEELAKKSNNHNHPYRPDTWVPAWTDVTGRPSSLPANGGNADTVDGKHVNDSVADALWTGTKINQAITAAVNAAMAKVKLKKVVESKTTSTNATKSFTITQPGFNTDTHSLEMRVGGVPFSETRYTVSGNTVTLKESETGIASGRRVDFIIHYIEK